MIKKFMQDPLHDLLMTLLCKAGGHQKMAYLTLALFSKSLTESDFLGKHRGMADDMAFGLEPVPYGSGMAPISWQSAPNAVAAPLRGQPHRTVSGQATDYLWASHGWRHGARCR